MPMRGRFRSSRPHLRYAKKDGDETLWRPALDAEPLRPLPRRRPSDDRDETPPEDERDRMDRPARRGPRVIRMLLWALVLIAITGAGAFLYVQYGLRTPVSVAADRLVIGEASLTPFREVVPVTGRLVPEETVFLDSVEGGRVTQVHLEEGAQVIEGEAIVTLANTNLELEAIGRETQFTEQKINLARAEMDFDNQDLALERQIMDVRLQIDLHRSALERRLPADKTGVPQAEIDRYQTELAFHEASLRRLTEARALNRERAQGNLEELRGSVARMERSVELMRQSLANLSIYAPIDGQLTLLDARVGEVVPPGGRVGQVDSVGDFKIEASIDEYYLGRLAPGQTAEVELAGSAYGATVRKIYPNVENRQFTVDLLFEDARPEGLRQGQSMRVRIELSDLETTLTIPNGPYYEQTGGLWVFVVSPDGRFADRREVTLGRRNPERIEVLAGLEPGEKVIVSGYDGLLNRTRIELRNEN